MKKGNHYTAVVNFLCIFAVLLGFSLNTLFFHDAINRVSRKYQVDNNRQVASHIAYRLKAGDEFIADFADTLGRMPDFLLTEELLERKARAMELEGIAVLSPEEVRLSFGEVPDLARWAAEWPQVWERPMVSYIQDRCLIFSAPVVKEGGTAQLVAGMQSYAQIQALMNRVHYKKSGVNILLDRDARAPIMVEENSALPLEGDEVAGMLEKLAEVDTSLEESTDDVYVSAEPIEGMNWLRISIVPAGLLASEMRGYVMVYLGLVILGLVLLVAAAYHFRRIVRRREQIFMHDALTGGYNREGFLAEGARLLDANGLASYSVASLNVCNFRYINEMWGEDSGNRTLRFVYRMFKESVGREELVCRSNMDHFLVLFHERGEAEVRARVVQMIDRIHEAMYLHFGAYAMDFTAGSCRLELTQNLNSAISNACYAEKQSQEKNVCSVYNEETAKSIAEENQLNELFEASIQQRHFKVYLQPKVSPVKGEPCRAEALVRWEHPERGTIFPNQFIHMFEKNGKICALDMYMFEEVCRLVAGWMRAGAPVTRVSVNVSRYHLKYVGAEIWKAYREIKERYGIPDGMIEVELTETMMVERAQLSFVKQVLSDFRACGLEVALDDFGFAYSSLALLKEFEIDTLKLDRGFFINETEKSRKIVENIIRLAHSLGMRVVAEGIETEEQVEALRRNGCDLIQGYVYSRPLSVEKFEEWRSAHEQ